jgi:hypothetical protein
MFILQNVYSVVCEPHESKSKVLFEYKIVYAFDEVLSLGLISLLVPKILGKSEIHFTLLCGWMDAG